jgi:hypothetical protein
MWYGLLGGWTTTRSPCSMMFTPRAMWNLNWTGRRKRAIVLLSLKLMRVSGSFPYV